MIKQNTCLLEHFLTQSGYGKSILESLKNDGHVLLPENNINPTLLVPTKDGDALFMLTKLLSVEPARNSSLLALALNLNLSPAYTLAACVALDIENHNLCLRSTHNLSGAKSNMLSAALEQHQKLAQQVKEILLQYKQDVAARNAPSFTKRIQPGTDTFKVRGYGVKADKLSGK
ncbi:MAG: CesT family type III secretion system chaperone [Exilibacterium sp.]|jgi:hypothetical protein